MVSGLGGAPTGLVERPGHAATPWSEAGHPPIELGYLCDVGLAHTSDQVSLERR